MALLKIKGRVHFIKVSSIETHDLGSGSHAVQFDGNRQFMVVGGLKSGGAANEWFCIHPELYGAQWVPCKSMVEAIKIGAQY